MLENLKTEIKEFNGVIDKNDPDELKDVWHYYNINPILRYAFGYTFFIKTYLETFGENCTSDNLTAFIFAFWNITTNYKINADKTIRDKNNPSLLPTDKKIRELSKIATQKLLENINNSLILMMFNGIFINTQNGWKMITLFYGPKLIPTSYDYQE